MTPHQALRVIEREFKMAEGMENDNDREEALSTLWDYVILRKDA